MSAIKKTLSIVFLLIFLAALTPTESLAQCPMCKASVEANQKGGGKTGNGLNSGIMYLLAAPYLAVAAVGFLWYKKYRKKNIEIKMKDQKLNLN